MARLAVIAFCLLTSLMVAACNSPAGQGGGQAGSGLQRPAVPSGMTAAQAAAYCTGLARTYDEFVGSIGPALGGNATGGAPADLETKVAIAGCQDGNYAAGIPVLQQKLRDARVAVPSPPG
jgi:predicted small secreted protein